MPLLSPAAETAAAVVVLAAAAAVLWRVFTWAYRANRIVQRELVGPVAGEETPEQSRTVKARVKRVDERTERLPDVFDAIDAIAAAAKDDRVELLDRLDRLHERLDVSARETAALQGMVLAQGERLGTLETRIGNLAVRLDRVGGA